MISVFQALIKNMIGASIIVILSFIIFSNARSQVENVYDEIMDYPIHTLIHIDITT